LCRYWEAKHAAVKEEYDTVFEQHRLVEVEGERLQAAEDESKAKVIELEAEIARQSLTPAA
jgi:hypothetical protein